MKAALIPPKGYEHTVLESDIHLVLPLQPLLNNLDYIAAYKAARARGDYIILDNGCAEGQLVDGRTLIDFAHVIGAHEIVAPDVMSSAAATLEWTKNFLDEFPEAADYSIMAVLQGETPDEREFLLHQYAKLDAITTIGVPKVIAKRYGGTERFIAVKRIHQLYPQRFKIHLLGLNGNFPTEIFQMPFEGVRSMDSAQPYKLAEIGHVLSTHRAWADRRDTYFVEKKEVDPRVLAGNIATFLSWARRFEIRES